MLKTFPLTLILLSAAPQSWAFLAPVPTITRRPGSIGGPLQLTSQNDDGDSIAGAAEKLDAPQRRRDFLQSLGAAALISTTAISSFPSITHADGDDYLNKRGGEEAGEGDLTSQLFNPDGSIKDPNTVVEAQENAVKLPFSTASSADGVRINVATDGVQSATDATTNLKASYKLPVKWNQDATSQLPLYYDSSEGKNGKSCNRITIFSVASPNKIDMTTLEKASRIGVAKSLFMDQIPNKYFDQAMVKADLIGGRTVRKPIKSLEEEGEFDEQVYYEFDLAFAPSECPDYMDGNKENLGLGFCPYENIFLVSATVVKNSEKDKNGTLMCCVVECNKDEWKKGNSDVKRVRSSFALERA